MKKADLYNLKFEGLVVCSLSLRYCHTYSHTDFNYATIKTIRSSEDGELWPLWR